jgi:hypothetical protein
MADRDVEYLMDVFAECTCRGPLFYLTTCPVHGTGGEGPAERYREQSRRHR